MYTIEDELKKYLSNDELEKYRSRGCYECYQDELIEFFVGLLIDARREDAKRTV